MESNKSTGVIESSPRRVWVMRWGHRPSRDARLTTHVALVARALGASGIFVTDIVDRGLEHVVNETVENWGGSFKIETGVPWKKVVENWKGSGGITVHLTMYGENIAEGDVLKRIKDTEKDVLLIVGCQKVPPDFFSKEVSDFNVAIGNQPHSECAAVAIFLDRFFEGRPLRSVQQGGRIKIIPQRRGKRVARRNMENRSVGDRSSQASKPMNWTTI